MPALRCETEPCWQLVRQPQVRELQRQLALHRQLQRLSPLGSQTLQLLQAKQSLQATQLLQPLHFLQLQHLLQAQSPCLRQACQAQKPWLRV